MQLLLQGLHLLLDLGRSLPVTLCALDGLLGLIFALDRFGDLGRLRLLAPLQLGPELLETDPVWFAVEALSPLGLRELMGRLGNLAELLIDFVARELDLVDCRA